MPFGKCRLVLALLSLLVCCSCAGMLSSAEMSSSDGDEQFRRYNAEQLKQAGEKFLAAGNQAQALRYLTWAEQKAPKDPLIQYDLGVAYQDRGMETEALVHLQKATVLKPDYSEAYNALGACYAEQRRYDKAEDAFRKALSNPFYTAPEQTFYNLGTLYERMELPEEALKQYRQAVKLNAQYGPAYYRIGQLLEKSRMADEAKRAYAQAIRVSPDLVEAHLRYGIMCYTSGELGKALYSLTKVVRLAPPDSAMAEEAKGYIQRLRGLTHSEEVPVREVPASTARLPTPNREKQTGPAIAQPEELSNIEVMTPEDVRRQKERESKETPASVRTVAPHPTVASAGISSPVPGKATPNKKESSASHGTPSDTVKPKAETSTPSVSPSISEASPPAEPVPSREAASREEIKPKPETTVVPVQAGAPATSETPPPAEPVSSGEAAPGEETKPKPETAVAPVQAGAPATSETQAPAEPVSPGEAAPGEETKPKAEIAVAPVQAGAPAASETPAPAEPPASPDNAPGKETKPDATVQTGAEPAIPKKPPEAPPAPQYQYIVQVGSWLDKEHAVQLRDSLHKKGYKAAVRSVKHKDLESVYVIQLEPVHDIAKASTLMMQLGSETESQPVIIKLPVGASHPAQTKAKP